MNGANVPPLTAAARPAFVAIKGATDYLSIEELTHTLLREMVEKIVVYECEYDENEVRRQRIDIYYSFVGKIDLPEE